MGLRGLPHYIGQTCTGIFKKHVRLQNTRVIVDGNNFLRTFILSLHGYDDCMLGFGCNYDTYYNALKEFVCKFRLCNIELVFVFVGTTSCQDFIFKRVQYRNQEKINRLEAFINDNYEIRPHDLPQALLAKTTLVRCLNDNDIHHLTMDFEEDGQIVALANRWGCPIITSDSDFYLYPYENGAYAIPWWRFDRGMEVHGREPHNYLETLAYKTQDFARYHGLRTEYVPLFAAVQLQRDENENFLEDLPLLTDERDEQLRELLERIRDLARSNTLQDLLSNPDEFFFDEEDEDLRAKILEKVDVYTLKPLKIEYYSFLEEGETVIKSEIKTRSGRSLPDWFIQGFRASSISRYFAGVLAARATVLYTQLEDLDSPSPNDSTTDIRAVLWGILLQYENVEDLEDAAVYEYYRESKEVIERTLRPRLVLNGTRVPALQDIPQMPENDRLQFIFKVLQIDFSKLESYPENTWFFILVTRYWVRECRPSNAFIQAMILCYIKLGYYNASSLSGLSLEDREIRAIEAVPSRSLNRAKRNLQVRDMAIPAIKNSPNRIKSHHVFALWKTIYSEVYRLNEIMLKPLEELGPEHCFRATFLYSVQWYLDPDNPGANNAETFIQHKLGEVYRRLYVPLWNVIVM